MNLDKFDRYAGWALAAVTIAVVVWLVVERVGVR